MLEGVQVDSRFSFHALAASDPYVRFYCGVPIVTGDGYAVTIGTLAVMDRVPRKRTQSHCLALQRLARQAAALLELRMLRYARPAAEEGSQRDSQMLRLRVGTSRLTGLAYWQELVETLARSTWHDGVVPEGK